MQSVWLMKNEKDKLLLFFNGWGMDINPFRRLDSEIFDVLAFSDYSDLALDPATQSLIAPYHEICVVAWSMGVWAAGAIQPLLPQRLAYALAVNGTLHPIDDRAGIPAARYRLTLDRFSTDVRDRFYRAMFSSNQDWISFSKILPERDLTSQHEELSQLRRHVLDQPAAWPSLRYDAALISREDGIWPANNQLRAWQGQCRTHPIDSGHFPFFRWRAWEDLLADALR